MELFLLHNLQAVRDLGPIRAHGTEKDREHRRIGIPALRPPTEPGALFRRRRTGCPIDDTLFKYWQRGIVSKAAVMSPSAIRPLSAINTRFPFGYSRAPWEAGVDKRYWSEQ